jgi:hypothetical protein
MRMIGPHLPEFSGLVVFVEQTLLYQTMYLQFYTMRTWTYLSFPKKRFSLIIKQKPQLFYTVR